MRVNYHDHFESSREQSATRQAGERPDHVRIRNKDVFKLAQLNLAGHGAEPGLNRKNGRSRDPDCGWLCGIVFTTDATGLSPLPRLLHFAV